MELITYVRLGAQSLLLLLIERRQLENNLSRLRMQAVRRDHYRCRDCGKQGDEITLQVCQLPLGNGTPETLTLCATCYRRAAGPVMLPHFTPICR